MRNLKVYKPESGLEHLREWQKMPREKRRVEALKLINDRNHEGLWEMTHGYLLLKGEKRGAVSRYTVTTYRRGVLDLLNHWEGENLLRLTPDAGDEWVAYLSSPKTDGGLNLSPSSIRVKLAAGRTLFRALRWAGVFDGQNPEDRLNNADPFKDVSAPADGTAPEDKRDAYTDEEIAALIDGATKTGRIEDVVMVLLGAHAGLRKSEMLSLQWRHVDFVKKTVFVESGKGKKDRTVGASRSLLDALRASKQATGYVLPYRSTTRLYDRLRAIAEHSTLLVTKPDGTTYTEPVEIASRGVHGLRHAAGTRMYEATTDLHVVAKFLGHSQLQTAARYAKVRQTTRMANVVSTW